MGLSKHSAPSDEAARRLSRSALVTVLAIAVGSCGGGSGTAQPAAISTPSAAVTSVAEPHTEEMTFRVGSFELAGDLVLPAGRGPHPAVLVVGGSGAQTRTRAPGYSLVLQRFGDAGFAVFSWDTPGSGASTGDLDPEHTLSERASIVAGAVAELARRPDIDENLIGLWGISQAGWVMPLALELTDGIDFMIVVSGGGEDSIEQGAYQLGQLLVCDGGTHEDAALVAQYGPQAAKDTTYEGYVEAMEILLAIPGIPEQIGAEISAAEDWTPWPAHIDAYLNPIDVIEHTTIPVLAVFGDRDVYVDPVQGADAFRRALEVAGNDDFRVELLSGVGHTMQEEATGCPGTPKGPVSERYLQLLDEFIDKLVDQRADS